MNINFLSDDALALLEKARLAGRRFAVSLNPIDAWLVVHGFADCINRRELTNFRGELFIHATRQLSSADYQKAYQFATSIDAQIVDAFPYYPDIVKKWCGGIVGRVDIVGTFPALPTTFTSFWHEPARVGWQCAYARDFGGALCCKGSPAIWEVVGVELVALNAFLAKGSK